MRDLAVLLLHVLATIARLAGPGGVRAVVAESVLVKHQLLILNRARKRSPRLRLRDRVVCENSTDAGFLTIPETPSVRRRLPRPVRKNLVDGVAAGKVG